MDEQPIYNFGKLKDFLEDRGVYVGDAQGYVPVTPEDVFDKNGNTSLVFENEVGEDGIFVPDKKGRLHQVYMYKYPYHVSGYANSMPRFHICKCGVIESFMEQGRFGEYHYANTEEVDVKDLDTHPNEILQMSGLPLCSQCAAQMSRMYERNMDSDEFVQILKEAGEVPEELDMEQDIFGYVKDWPKISKAYRELHNYTCEKCGFTAPSKFEQTYIHVHHIDGDKLNNKQSNLQCLCIRCHANVDARHQENFSKGDKHRQLEQFCKLHKPMVAYTQSWTFREFLAERGQTTWNWGTRSGGKIRCGIFVDNEPYLFDDSMGDMNGEDGRQKLLNSVVVETSEGKIRIFNPSLVELMYDGGEVGPCDTSDIIV